jgi:hypothetical protein
VLRPADTFECCFFGIGGFGSGSKQAVVAAERAELVLKEDALAVALEFLTPSLHLVRLAFLQTLPQAADAVEPLKKLAVRSLKRFLGV